MLQSESSTKELPDRIRRSLLKGETIYHSALPCHVSRKYPEGKWIAQVRRDERGKLIKYPVKGFGTPREAFAYIQSLRPDQKGRVYAARQGEPTVADLYEYVTKHHQKRIVKRTKDGKASRWTRYIAPEWADVQLSEVTRRRAQEWVTDVESKIEKGTAGTLGIPQFENVRTDLHALFECLESFDPRYEDRKNPFAGLEFSARLPRPKVTIESGSFPAIYHACQEMSALGLCTSWIADMFLTGLLAGLREGEVLALCVDQIDFENGAIVVDRALRRDSRAIDPATRRETGEIQRQAVHFPKGGSAANPKTRVVPMSDQLAALLSRAIERRHESRNPDWDLIWPSEAGKLRELTRFANAWKTLRNRLDELATLAPLNGREVVWPEIPKRRGWPQNPLVQEARSDARLRLPNLFGAIDYRDTRSSFASYMNELELSQATREHFLGHGGGLTNMVYTTVTSAAFKEARERLTNGWRTI